MAESYILDETGEPILMEADTDGSQFILTEEQPTDTIHYITTMRVPRCS